MDAQLTFPDSICIHVRRRDAIFLAEVNDPVGCGDGLWPMRDDYAGELELPDGLIDPPLSRHISGRLRYAENGPCRDLRNPPGLPLYLVR